MARQADHVNVVLLEEVQAFIRPAARVPVKHEKDREPTLAVARGQGAHAPLLCTT